MLVLSGLLSLLGSKAIQVKLAQKNMLSEACKCLPGYLST